MRFLYIKIWYSKLSIWWSNLSIFFKWNYIPVNVTILSLILVIIGYVLLYEHISLDAIQQTSGAIIQLVGSLLALVLIGIPILWDQRNNSLNSLLLLKPKYIDMLIGNKASAIKSWPIEKLRTAYFYTKPDDFNNETDEYSRKQKMGLKYINFISYLSTSIGKNNESIIKKALADINLSKDDLNPYTLRNPSTFFKTLEEILDPLGILFTQLTLSEKIRNSMDEDNCGELLERINHFRGHTGYLFYSILILLLIEIFLSLLTMAVPNIEISRIFYSVEIGILYLILISLLWYIWSFIGFRGGGPLGVSLLFINFKPYND